MKSIFTLATIFLTTTIALGQITFEHSYPCNYLQRGKLETAGEKYYYVDAESSVVRFFNADHTPWKTVPVTLVADASFNYVYLASEHIFNQDDAVEFYLYSGSSTSRINAIYNENGEVILEALSPNYFNVAEVDGEWKVWFDNGTVVTADGLVFQHSFPQYPRILFDIENEGDKYWYQDWEGSYLFFNADFTLWKKIEPQDINTDCNSNSIVNNPAFEVFDNDANIEIGVWGQCASTGNYEFRVLDESGEVQHQYQNGSGGFFFPLTMPDGSGGYQWVAWTSNFSVFYSLPEFDIIQQYPFGVTGRVFSVSGYKFYNGSIGTINSSYFQFYNPDHTPWKQLSKPSGYEADIVIADEHVFTDDNTLVAVVNYANFFESGMKILTEFGQELLTLGDANNSYVSNIPGLARKLITGHYEQEPAGLKFTHVYSLPTTTPSPTKEQLLESAKIGTSPNPFSNTLTLDFPESILPVSEVVIFDALGNIVFSKKEINSQALKIESVGHWSPGIYFLQVRSLDGHVFSQKLIKS